MKFHRIAEEVEAFQWTGDEKQADDPEWMIDLIKKRKCEINYPEVRFIFEHGERYAFPGYWIVKTRDGIETYTDAHFKERFSI